MSEWKKQVEDKAKLTAIHYVLDSADEKVRIEARTPKRRRTTSDSIYGIFAILMSIAMALIAVGFYATATGAYAADGARSAVIYMALALVMMFSGIRSIIGSRR